MPLSETTTDSSAEEQAGRIRAVASASALSLALPLWLSLGAVAGYLSWSLVYWTLAVVSLCVVSSLGVMLTGVNLRFKEPGLTLPIVLAAASTVLAVAHQLEPSLRPAVLPWMIMAFAFAAVSSRTRSLLKLAVFIGLFTFIESALYVRSNGYWDMVSWQAVGILGSIGCITFFSGRLNDRRTASKKKLRHREIVLDSMSEAVVSIDLNGDIVEINAAAEQSLKVLTRDARGLSVHQLLPAATEAELRHFSDFLAARSERASIRFNARSPAGDKQGQAGAVSEIDCTASLVRNPKGKPIGQVLVLRDLNATSRLVRQLEHDSNHDELTGLMNRRGLQAALKHTIDSLQRCPDGTQHAVLIVDLDQFKIVNDTCGHVAGDALLIQVAQSLRASVRGADVVSRYGGDEFALVLQNVNEQNALTIAQKALNAIVALQFSWEDRSFQASASIGCSMVDKQDREYGAVIERADSALYVAKNLGRCRVQMHLKGSAPVERALPNLEWAI